MTVKKPITFDEYIERIIKPLADAGDQSAIVMMEGFALAKAGKMTPRLARELAAKAVPD